MPSQSHTKAANHPESSHKHTAEAQKHAKVASGSSDEAHANSSSKT
jgi:hypothetical protein